MEEPPTSGGPWASVAVEGGYSCGLTQDGAAYCWGAGTSGTVPSPVLPTLRFQSLAATQGLACAVTTDGVTWCWAVGPGAVPTPAAQHPTFRFRQIIAGRNNICALSMGATVLCWSRIDAEPRTPTALPGGHSFTSLMQGTDRFCGVTTAGVALCWGDLANWSAVSIEVVANGAVAVWSNGAQACVLLADGSAACRGSNRYGQLGDGTRTDRATFAPVSGGHRFRTLASSGWSTCGITEAGAAHCWGVAMTCLPADGAGPPVSDCETFGGAPLGAAGANAAPVAWMERYRLRGLALHPGHSCAVTTEGSAYCWGANSAGELGLGTQSRGTAVPQRVVDHKG